MALPRFAEHVLVADDSLSIRRLVATRLRHAGFRVTEAADGFDALERFREEPSAVVITDVGMPGLGGLDLLARLRCHNPAPEVILLTGTHADDARVAVEALRLGAHDYINKDPESLEAVVLAASRALDKFRLRNENFRLLDRLRTQSLTDSLTGAGNRRAFDRVLVRDIAHARRERSGLALVMLDLDFFKRVNDALGHRVGDEVLVQVATRLKGAVRASDEVFRYGGESGGAVAAARCVGAIAAQPFEVGGERLPITCSAGVAELADTDADSGADILARADAALYEAKRSGRNQVVVYRARIEPSLPEMRAC
jgi:two-component system chemotaxis family response regulator WspR